MSTLLKKFILSFLSFLILFFSVTPNLMPAKAADTATWYNSSFGDWFNKVYNENTSPGNEIFGERYTAAQVQWVIYSVPSVILNLFVDPKITSCFITDTKDINSCVSLVNGLISSNNMPFIADTKPSNSSLLSLVFADRPLSGVSYVKEMVQGFELVPVAHAQTPGFGFTALNVVQDVWQASRDIAFGLFVLAAVVLAFMIMFRVKISPQVVISVQSAIPKLIIALILVTFSYAIAGFLIDLMYVVYGIISVIGTKFVPGINIQPASVFQFLTAGRIGWGSVGVDLGIMGLLALYLVLLPLSLIMVLFATIGIIQSAILGLVGVGLAAIFGPALITTGLLIIIVLIALIIIHGAKVLFCLIKAYVNILLLTMFAPLQIVAGVLIPNFSFGSWLKSFVSNLAIFVVASVLVFFSFIFMVLGVEAGFDSIAGAGTAFPSFLAKIIFGSSLSTGIVNIGRESSWPPLLGATGLTGGATSMTGILFLAVSFVMFMLIPKAADIVQSFISGKPFAYGSAISEPLNSIWGMTGAPYLKTAQEIYSQARLSNWRTTLQHETQTKKDKKPGSIV